MKNEISAGQSRLESLDRTEQNLTRGQEHLAALIETKAINIFAGRVTDETPVAMLPGLIFEIGSRRRKITESYMNVQMPRLQEKLASVQDQIALERQSQTNELNYLFAEGFITETEHGRAMGVLQPSIVTDIDDSSRAKVEFHPTKDLSEPSEDPNSSDAVSNEPTPEDSEDPFAVRRSGFKNRLSSLNLTGYKGAIVEALLSHVDESEGIFMDDLAAMIYTDGRHINKAKNSVAANLNFLKGELTSVGLQVGSVKVGEGRSARLNYFLTIIPTN